MYSRITSSGRAIRSGEELFRLENKHTAYDAATRTFTWKSCDIEDGVTSIHTYEQFYTGHDDSEIVVEIRDKDGKVLWEWAFDHIMGSGATVEAENLIGYLEKKFNCPVRRSSWFC